MFVYETGNARAKNVFASDHPRALVMRINTAVHPRGPAAPPQNYRMLGSVLVFLHLLRFRWMRADPPRTTARSAGTTVACPPPTPSASTARSPAPLKSSEPRGARSARALASGEEEDGMAAGTRGGWGQRTRGALCWTKSVLLVRFVFALKRLYATPVLFGAYGCT